MEWLGLNRDGYFGERIDLDAVLRDVDALADQHGWERDELVIGDGRSLPALRRRGTEARRRIYVSTGIHGDEPAGPLAVRELLRENRWPSDAALWLCPCLNPWGFAHNVRTNEQGIDLNRDYRHLQAPEVRGHVDWLRRQPRFDLAVCLHEDWEARGFYVYELAGPGHVPRAPLVIAAVAPVCPIDRSAEIDGRPARDGIISPSIEVEARPLWPEALYLFSHHTTCCLTLEAPSDLPLGTRVAALAAGTRALWEG